MGGSRQKAGASRDRREGKEQTRDRVCSQRARQVGQPPRDPHQTLEIRASEPHHSYGHLQEQTHDSLGDAGHLVTQAVPTLRRGGVEGGAQAAAEGG